MFVAMRRPQNSDVASNAGTGFNIRDSQSRPRQSLRANQLASWQLQGKTIDDEHERKRTRRIQTSEDEQTNLS